jgi:hypothetical protein
MKQWVFEFLSRASPIQATTLVVTCWYLWEARNNSRNGFDQLHPARLAGKITAYVNNIIQYCFKTSSTKRCDSSSSPCWFPPPVGFVFVNVDAALFKAEDRIGVGVVVRDHMGSLKLACSEGLAGCVYPELAEALAVRRALTLTKDHGFRSIILASDCLSLIQKISSSVRDRTLVGSLVGDIQRLASEFSVCSFKHVGHRKLKTKPIESIEGVARIALRPWKPCNT